MTAPILTVTLNPALDMTTATAELRPEEKLRCDAPRYDPGGAESTSPGQSRNSVATATPLLPSEAARADTIDSCSRARGLRSTPEGLARDYVKSHSWKVADVMTTPVVTVGEDASLREVAELMEGRGIKRLPVMREDRLAGIISRADLLRAILDDQPAAIASGDEAIAISVKARLLDAGHILSKQPTVSVNSGVVGLYGTLRSQAERDTARVVVESVPGVAGFEDHITIEAA